MKLPKLNLRVALKQRQSKTGNPMQYDPVLMDLMDCLETITTYEVFQQWRNQFLERFETYLQGEGNEPAAQAYENFRTKLDKLVESVAKVAHQINEGKINKKKVSVKSRNALNEVSRDCQIIIIELFGLAPATAAEEKVVGYNKYHMGSILIRDGLNDYERLNICKDVMKAMRDRTLEYVCDGGVLQSMEDYDRSINRFFSLMQDLGIHRIMLKSNEVNPTEPPKQLLDEIHGEKLRKDVNLSHRFGISSDSKSGGTLEQDSDHAPKIKTKETDGTKSKRKKDPGRKQVSRRRSGLLQRQDSNESLYVEDENKRKSNFCIPKSVRNKVTPVSDAMSPEGTTSTKSDGHDHWKGISKVKNLALDIEAAAAAAGGKKKSKSGTSPKRKVRDGGRLGKISTAPFEAVVSDGVPSPHSKTTTTKEFAVQKHDDVDDKDKPKESPGLVRLQPKSKRSTKKNGDNNDDNRSVVSISSKKKAKLKAIQARKGKQDPKKSLRDKKDAIRKSRNSKIDKAATTRNSLNNLNQEEESGDSQKKAMESWDGSKHEAAEVLTKSEHNPHPPQHSDIETAGKDGKNAGDDGLNPGEISPKDVSGISTRPLSTSTRRDSNPITSPRGTASGRRCPPATSPTPTTGERNVVASSSHHTHNGRPTPHFQWPPTRPRNIDISSKKLKDKWTPPPPNGGSDLLNNKSLPEKSNNGLVHDAGRRRGTESKHKAKRKGPKKWPSSLLSKMDDNDDEDEEDELILDDSGNGVNDVTPSGKSNDGVTEGSEDFTFATIQKKYQNDKVSTNVAGASSGNNERKTGGNAEFFTTIHKKFLNEKSGTTRTASDAEVNTARKEGDGEDFSFASLHKKFLTQQDAPTPPSPHNKLEKVGGEQNSGAPSENGIDSSDSLMDLINHRTWTTSVYETGEKTDEEEEISDASPSSIEKLVVPATKDSQAAAGLPSLENHPALANDEKIQELVRVTDDFVLIPFDAHAQEEFSIEKLRNKFTNNCSLSIDLGQASRSKSEIDTYAGSTGVSPKSPGPLELQNSMSPQPKSSSSSTKKVKIIRKSPSPGAMAMKRPTSKVSTPKLTASPGYRAESRVPKLFDKSSMIPDLSALGSQVDDWRKQNGKGLNPDTADVDDTKKKTTVTPTLKRLTVKPSNERKTEASKLRGNSPKPRDRSKSPVPTTPAKEAKQQLKDTSEFLFKLEENQTPLGLADLFHDEEDEDDAGIIFHDDSIHMHATMFKPISDWASPPDDDDRSGPAARKNSQHRKQKTPVAKVRKVGKGNTTADRMKTQYKADDSSIVKVRKRGNRRKGEVTLEKHPDPGRSKIKPKLDGATTGLNNNNDNNNRRDSDDADSVESINNLLSGKLMKSIKV